MNLSLTCFPGLSSLKEIAAAKWGPRTVMAASLLLASCGSDPFPDYHYKMTVYVGDKAYSSVRSVRQKQVFSAADSSGSAVKREVEGEAVVLRLGDGRTIYALLSKPDELDYAKKVAGYALLPLVPKFQRDPRFDDLRAERGTEYLDRLADAQQAMVAIEGPKDLPRSRPNPRPASGPSTLDNWPMFVTFDDPKDPKTVREVSPESIGVSRITIEITEEGVTNGIDKQLGWLGEFPEPRLDRGYRGSANPNLSQSLTHGAFREGSNQ